MKLTPNIVAAVDQNYSGGSTVHVAVYSYNELGEVIMKSLGYVNPTTWLQNVNMRYSIRGQLLNINNSKLVNDGGITSNESNDLFGMQLLYDGTDSHLDNGAGNVNKFDGRLTAVKWMSTDASGNKSYERSYVYTYDNVARYTAETYSERTVLGTGPFNNNLNGFDESGISYDENGNILSLQRNSSTQGTNSHIQIDNLTYGYLLSNYNRVNTITDGTGTNYTGAGFRNLTGLSTAYAYDANGNLTNDYYKGLQNSYNVLNRVDNTTITTGTNQYINYIYDAGGSLIRKLAYNNGALTTTDYVGGFVYINGTLSYFPMPEGRVLVSGSTYTQEYIITDQQGNARISFKNNGSNAAVVTHENSYYGFGLQLLNSPVSPPPVPNKQLYNGGSEWQNDYANGSTNLPDYYQTFNRNYDAAIGRFISQDPTPESAADMSVYQYAGDNPGMLNDPMGNKVVPASTYNFNYVSPLMPNSGPLDGGWQNQGDFFNPQDLGGGTGGVYGVDPDLAWSLGNAEGTNIYDANGGTGMSFGHLTSFLNSGNISINNNGQSTTVSYDYSYTKTTSSFLGSNSGLDYWWQTTVPVIGSGTYTIRDGGDDNQGEDPWIGHTITVISYIGIKQTYVAPGNLWQSVTQPFVGHIYGEEGKLSTINVTLTVSDKAEINGYDIGTPYGIGSGTDFYEAEHDLNYSNSTGGVSIGYDYNTGYRTFINYFNLPNGNIQGTMTTIIPTGQQNLERNLNNVLQHLLPPPMPVPNPFLNPVTN